MAVSDYGHIKTDEKLATLEKQIANVYSEEMCIRDSKNGTSYGKYAAEHDSGRDSR